MVIGRTLRKGWGLLASWRWLMTEGRTLLGCTLDRRTPWYAKLAAIATVIYVVSPLDIVPEFIPFIGILDDVLVIPAGLALVRWLIPAEVWTQHARRNLKEAKQDPVLRRSLGDMKVVGRGRA